CGQGERFARRRSWVARQAPATAATTTAGDAIYERPDTYDTFVSVIPLCASRADRREHPRFGAAVVRTPSARLRPEPRRHLLAEAAHEELARRHGVDVHRRAAAGLAGDGTDGGGVDAA